MNIARPLIRHLSRVGIVHRLAFWVESQHLSFDHHRRYPSDPRWHGVAPSPIEKYDVCCAQIGRYWYVIGGYMALNQVNSFMDVFDLKLNEWVKRIDMPATMAQTHVALTTDGERYIYAVSGQSGPNCSPAVRDGFVYDANETQWCDLPPLPEARYAATMQLWRGRLHVIGGSMPDRYAPSNDHWSIAVADGRAVESAWQREIPIPLRAQDRPSAVVDDALYVFGGQSGDYVRVPGSTSYECNGRVPEEYFSHTYRLKSLDGPWERLADMPVGASHMSFPVIIGKSVLTIGGQIFKHPESFKLELTDAIQKYDTETNRWTIIGHTPYRLKTAAVAYYDGWVYITTGQRDLSARCPYPDRILQRSWRARLAGTDEMTSSG